MHDIESCVCVCACIQVSNNNDNDNKTAVTVPWKLRDDLQTIIFNGLWMATFGHTLEANDEDMMKFFDATDTIARLVLAHALVTNMFLFGESNLWRSVRNRILHGALGAWFQAMVDHKTITHKFVQRYEREHARTHTQ